MNIFEGWMINATEPECIDVIARMAETHNFYSWRRRFFQIAGLTGCSAVHIYHPDSITTTMTMQMTVKR